MLLRPGARRHVADVRAAGGQASPHGSSVPGCEASRPACRDWIRLRWPRGTGHATIPGRGSFVWPHLFAGRTGWRPARPPGGSRTGPPTARPCQAAGQFEYATDIENDSPESHAGRSPRRFARCASHIRPSPRGKVKRNRCRPGYRTIGSRRAPARGGAWCGRRRARAAWATGRWCRPAGRMPAATRRLRRPSALRHCRRAASRHGQRPACRHG